MNFSLFLSHLSPVFILSSPFVTLRWLLCLSFCVLCFVVMMMMMMMMMIIGFYLYLQVGTKMILNKNEQEVTK